LGKNQNIASPKTRSPTSMLKMQNYSKETSRKIRNVQLLSGWGFVQNI